MPKKRRLSPVGRKDRFKVFHTKAFYNPAGLPPCQYLLVRYEKLICVGAEVWETADGYAGASFIFMFLDLTF